MEDEIDISDYFGEFFEDGKCVYINIWVIELDEDDEKFVDEIVRDFDLKYNGRIGNMW